MAIFIYSLILATTKIRQPRKKNTSKVRRVKSSLFFRRCEGEARSNDDIPIIVT